MLANGLQRRSIARSTSKPDRRTERPSAVSRDPAPRVRASLAKVATGAPVGAIDLKSTGAADRETNLGSWPATVCSEDSWLLTPETISPKVLRLKARGFHHPRRGDYSRLSCRARTEGGDRRDGVTPGTPPPKETGQEFKPKP